MRLGQQALLLRVTWGQWPHSWTQLLMGLVNRVTITSGSDRACRLKGRIVAAKGHLAPDSQEGLNKGKLLSTVKLLTIILQGASLHLGLLGSFTISEMVMELWEETMDLG